MQRLCTKWLFLFTIGYFTTLSAKAQYAFAVFFNNKASNSFQITDPGAYLSQRAIARRVAQHIAIDSTDIPVSRTYVDSAVKITGGKLYEQSKWLNFCVLLLNDSVSIRNLTGINFIDSIKCVGVYTDLIQRAPPHHLPTKKASTPDPTYFGNTWPQTKLTNGNCLYDSGYSGSGKLIAILDAGFADADSINAFNNLWASGRLVDAYNFVYDTDAVFSWSSHGTLVLSAMAGYLPGNYIGTAPDAMFALYITEYVPNDQPLEMLNMICGAERADSIGADIITASLVYDLMLNPADDLTFSQLDGKTTYCAKAANIATQKGMIFVATAGNNGQGLTAWGKNISTPADADSAITVGATDTSGDLTDFSSYGPNAAGIIKPDVCAMGFFTDLLYYDASATINTNESGTSFATPQIAGWAACLWQACPTATPAQIRWAINASANHYYTPTPQGGYGIPDFCTSLDLLKNITTGQQQPWISFYPDPCDEFVNFIVNLNVAGTVTNTITDMSGRLVQKTTTSLQSGLNAPVTIGLYGLPSGLYLLKTTCGNNEHVVKLVKY